MLIAVLLAPIVVRRQNGSGRLARISAAIRRGAPSRSHGPERVPESRASGSFAATSQLAAWGVQLLACAVLFKALGMHGVGIGAAAAAVLFAVNVTAVVPATPSNIGVFQLAVISVLTTGFGVAAADALAYGVILQAVEVATAVVLGLPALVREGLTWSDMRLRALSAAPVSLSPRKSGAGCDRDQLAVTNLGRPPRRGADSMALSNIAGFPRIGPQRELKFATEGYWRGEVSSGRPARDREADPRGQLEVHAAGRGGPDPLERLLPLRPRPRHDRPRRGRAGSLRALAAGRSGSTPTSRWRAAARRTGSTSRRWR